MSREGEVGKGRSFSEVSMRAMEREKAIAQIQQRDKPWDVVVIGGGATGVGVALDAASRGLECLLVEQADFGKGTSSRSTKLVHGGVRYLRQGNLTLVRDALLERSLLRNNAPHLVHDLAFMIPCKNSWEKFFYGSGLKLYDYLAIRNSFSRSRGVNAADVARLVPALRADRHGGGVVYHDGQFDDARLLVNMARTAVDHGACLVNYATVHKIVKNAEGRVCGVEITDDETGDVLEVRARAVVNATGPFCDAVRRLDDAQCESLVAASQGVHLVLPRSFFPGSVAMIVPNTSDGRVLFVIPWHSHALVGTTDTPIDHVPLEPSAQASEIQFLLETLADYLAHPPTINDVTSIFTGIRPLVRGDKSARTASLSRDHFIQPSPSGLITITGGKWTTVRKMSEDCVDKVIQWTGLTANSCQTKALPLHGFLSAEALAEQAGDSRAYYGADLGAIQQLESAVPGMNESLHPSLSLKVSDVVWAVRCEMARTVDDVLARRSRSLFLNAAASVAVAPRVSDIMMQELGKNQAWRESQLEAFQRIAKHYLPAVTTEQK
jgi:glycerol-3-phosphate dehydrogenase